MSQFLRIGTSIATAAVAYNIYAYNNVDVNSWKQFYVQFPGSDQKYFPFQSEAKFDAIVVGGGIVGIAVARELAARSQKVLLLERNADICSGPATGGNSGLGATGYDAPLGSLERKLLLRSRELHPRLYRSFGLSLEHVRKCGALVVAWTDDQIESLKKYESSENSIFDIVLLTADETREFEPGLSPRVKGAAYVPGEVVSDPWLVYMGYLRNALSHGAEIRTNTNVNSISKSGKFWTVNPGVDDFTTRHIINCGGLWGDDVEKLKSNVAPFSIHPLKPKKGQFIVYEKIYDENVPGCIIEPVYDEIKKTKGVIIWQTVYGNIIVGPTAEIIKSKTDRSNDQDVLENLQKYAEEKFPALKNHKIIGSYSGIRPATEFSDYQIHHDISEHWITVGGIRSTGLSASSGIAEYVADMITTPKQQQQHIQEPVVPLLTELCENYNENDQTTEIYGKQMKVTHPISIFGMSS